MSDALRELITKWRNVSCLRDQYFFGGKCPDCKAYSVRADELEAALRANPPEQAPWELALREWLWIAHGHGFGYGDDGEMQCSQCKEWDYKRTPLDVLVPQALKAQKEAALTRLCEHEAALAQPTTVVEFSVDGTPYAAGPSRSEG